MMDYKDYCELYHHGIKGQKWGVRRFQNEDGTLTPAGKARYGGDASKVSKKTLKKQLSTYLSSGKRSKEYQDLDRKLSKAYMETEEAKTHDAYSKYLEKTLKDFEKEHPGQKLYFDKQFAEAYNAAEEKAFKKHQEIAKSMADEYSSTLLKDLGYDVTEKGRKKISKMIRDMSN